MTNNINTQPHEEEFIVVPITNKFVIWYGYIWRWWYSFKMRITRPFRIWKLTRTTRRKPKLIIPKR